MCDGWTSICRSRPFSALALLFWASDTRRHPGCSDASLCQNIWASRTELAEKRTLKPLEDTPWGEFNHRCMVSLLISPFSHSEHHTTLFHTHPRTAWCHFSSLHYVSTSITLSIPLLALFFYWHLVMHICQWRNSFWLPITAGEWSSSTDVPIPWCPWCTVVKEVKKRVCSSKLKSSIFH